jgi:hypothetical protein
MDVNHVGKEDTEMNMADGFTKEQPIGGPTIDHSFSESKAPN